MPRNRASGLRHPADKAAGVLVFDQREADTGMARSGLSVRGLSFHTLCDRHNQLIFGIIAERNVDETP